MIRHDSATTYTSSMLEHIISRLNENARENGTKKFQDEILNTGTFSFLCPIENQICYPKYNFFRVSGMKSIIYIFQGVENLALISSITLRGNPIVAAVTNTVAAEKVFLRQGMKAPRKLQKLIDVARSVLAQLSQSTQQIDLRLKPKLICGHKNFTHFIWNELPTIDDAIFGQRELDIYILHDPFNLCMKPPYSGKLIPVERPSLLYGWNSSLLLMGASTFFPNKVRSRLLRSIIQEKNPIKRRIYITVRQKHAGRYLVNQKEFLICLIKSFHQNYDDMDFVLDGFSMPDDLGRRLRLNPAIDRCHENIFEERVKQSRAEIQEIIRAVPGVEKNIRDITGMFLSDALEIISSCSYYVCHAGTQQHKIAWLFPRNGYVHSNRSRISDNTIKIYEGQSECAIPSRPVPQGFDYEEGCMSECTIPPSRPDPENIEDVDSKSERHWKNGERWMHDENKNYIIRDINSVVQQILEDYSRALTGNFV